MKTKHMAVAAALAAALLAAACGGATPGGSPGSQDLSGEIEISGSSTVEPISALVAERFRAENPGVSITVSGPGTTDGFARFCNGETQISDASRPIDPEEVKACEANGISFLELKIAIDGITVLTSPANDAVDCLGFKDLYALLGPESEGFETWADANALAADIGAEHAPYPDAPLVVVGPGEESGTWGSFIELALEGTGEERGFDDVTTRPDYQATANDNVIVQGIAGSETSLGWVGYAYFEQSGDTTKALAIDGGKGCVEPTRDTITNGSYPLARDLFIYVNAEQAEKDPALAAFVNFYLSETGLASVDEVGYVHQPEDVLSKTQGIWDARRTGSLEV